MNIFFTSCHPCHVRATLVFSCLFLQIGRKIGGKLETLKIVHNNNATVSIVASASSHLPSVIDELLPVDYLTHDGGLKQIFVHEV